MCGVLVIASQGDARMSGPSVFAALRHRGPDSHGYEALRLHDTLFEFGHTRLAIRDLSQAGSQPMWSADRRWLLAFNGELYNQESLRTDIGLRQFRGHSDTETLIELIARDGIEPTLRKINGMYAFVALDRATGTVYAARDPNGIKPLYLCQFEGGGIAFASEIRAFGMHGLRLGALDESALSAYLSLRYVPSPQTLFTHVRRIEPGSWVSWRAGQPVSAHSFDPQFPSVAPRPGDLLTLESAGPAFGDALLGAVRRQLVSDVPVGVLLSGGLDSAVVAATLHRCGVSPQCFTVGFADDTSGASEIEDAANIARVLGLPHHSIKLTADELYAVIPKVVEHLEEPIGTTSTLAMWHLAAFAREQVTVALAGQGADEPLGGYRRHRVEALRAWVPRGLMPAARWVGARLPKSMCAGSTARLLGAITQSSWINGYLEQRRVFNSQDFVEFGLEGSGATKEVFQNRIHAAESSGVDDLARVLWLDARTQLADDLLLYGDKVSMAHSLEVRVPFLDAELLGFVEALPSSFRVDVRQTKRVLRAHARAVLPASIIARRKKGFMIPNPFKSARFATQARAIAHAELGSAGIGLKSGAVDRVLADGALGGQQQVRAWSLYSLALWRESFQRWM